MSVLWIFNENNEKKLIPSAKSAAQPVARWENFVAAQEVLTEDAAWIPLYQEVETQLRNPNLEGITFRSVGNEFDLRTATLISAE